MSKPVIFTISAAGDEEAAAWTERCYAFLADAGWRVLRFWNSDMTANREGVLDSIAQAAALTPTLSRKRERE